MIKIRYKVFTFFVTLSGLILYSSIGGYAYPSDIKGNAAEKQIMQWVDKGIISGYEDGTFRPDESITRAQFIKLINKTFGFNKLSNANFTDVKASDWFYSDVKKAAAEGYILSKSKRFRPDSKITRQDAVIMLSKALKGAKLDDSNIKSKFITRAEAIMLLDEAAGNVFSKPGNYGPKKDINVIDGNVTVTRANVKLNNTKITGNLYLTSGIGSGNVELNNVTVQGKTIVSGGGEHSIIIRNSNLGAVTVIKEGGKVRIVATGSTSIGQVTLNSGGTLEEREVAGEGFENVIASELPKDSSIVLDGDFESVILEAPGITIEVPDGKVANLEVGEQAANATLNVTGGAITELKLETTAAVNTESGSIAKLEVGKDASNTTIQVAQGATVGTLNAQAPTKVTGEGKIETANINSNGVSIEQKPETTNVSNGTTATVGGSNTTGNNGNGGGLGGGYVQQSVNISVVNAMLLMNDKAEVDGRTNIQVTPSDARLSFKTEEPSASIESINNNGIIKSKMNARGISTITVTASKNGYTDKSVSFKVAVNPIKLTWSNPSGEKLTGDKYDISFAANLLEGVGSIDGVTYVMSWTRDGHAVNTDDITLTNTIRRTDGSYSIGQKHKVVGNESATVGVTFNVPGIYELKVYAEKE